MKKHSMVNVAHIFEGFTNLITDYLGVLPEEKQIIAKDRLTICKDCPIRTGNLCDKTKTMKHLETGETVTGCGCVIPLKVLAMATSCPKGEW